MRFEDVHPRAQVLEQFRQKSSVSFLVKSHGFATHLLLETYTFEMDSLFFF